MSLLRALPLLALLALAGCADRPPLPTPPFTVRVTDAGLYAHAGAVVRRSAPGTVAGWVAEHEGLQLLRATQEIDARLGVTFGLRYRLDRVRDGPVRGLEMRVLHPAMRGPDGRVREESRAWTEVYGVDGVAVGDVAYTLSEPFEVLRGDWTLQVLWHGIPIVSRKFRLR